MKLSFKSIGKIVLWIVIVKIILVVLGLGIFVIYKKHAQDLAQKEENDDSDTAEEPIEPIEG